MCVKIKNTAYEIINSITELENKDIVHQANWARVCTRLRKFASRAISSTFRDACEFIYLIFK